MKISKSELTTGLISCLLVILAASGSIYYLYPNAIKLLFQTAFLFITIIPLLSPERLTKVPRIAFPVVMMMFLALYRNHYLSSKLEIVFPLLYVEIVLFLWLSRYQNSTWIDKTVNGLYYVYLFYAIYTIGMFFIPQLFQITLSLFPSKSETLTFQYNNGCMPGLTNHYSTNGMLVGMGCVISGCLMIYYKSNKYRKFIFAVFVVALLLTGKRGHIIFSAIAIFIGYYIFMSNKKKSRLINTVCILLLVLVILWFISNYVPALAVFINRFADAAETGDVTLGRVNAWDIAWETFKKNPLLGVGWSNYILIGYKGYNAHNIYLQILSETGIVGTVLYISFFIYHLTTTIKKLKYVRKSTDGNSKVSLYLMLSLSIQIFFLLYGFTGNPLYDKEMYIPYFVACSISGYYSFSKLKKVSESETGNYHTL